MWKRNGWGIPKAKIGVGNADCSLAGKGVNPRREWVGGGAKQWSRSPRDHRKGARGAV